MTGLEENIKELIVLSDLIQKQDFRSSFINHFVLKLKEFQSSSSKVDIKILQRLQLKLLDPFFYHLNTTNNSTDKAVLIQAITQILRLTIVNNIHVFFDVYTRVFFQIYKGGKLPYQPSEELKECVLECCTFLIKGLSDDVLNKVYSADFAGKLSLGVSISVDIVKEERSIQLRTRALDFLLAVSHFDGHNNYTKEILTKIGDVFMLFLPGILGPLLEVISRDETQHHSITAKSLRCWGHILCIVMKDTTSDKSLSDTEILQSWIAHQKKPPDELLDVKAGLQEKKRTKTWFESAATTLQPLVTKLSELRKHSHPKCRLELTQVMVNLLKFCIKNLKNCLSVMIEVLVSSSMDEDDEVKKTALIALQEFEMSCREKNIDVFTSVVEENLYSLIHKLPRIAQSGDQKILLPSLKSLSGYLGILGRTDRLQSLLRLSSTLSKLISAIRICFALEIYPEISNQDFSAFDQETQSVWHKQWKRFRWFADHSIQTQLGQICYDLGKYGHLETLIEFLLDFFSRDSLYRNEILLILNETLLGSCVIEDHLVSHILEFYLDPQNFYVPLQISYDGCENIREAQLNIIQVALIMEGIGKLAKKVGIKFREYLFKSLYYVLERMGSSYSIVREAATYCGGEIATSCGLDGFRRLIETNVDYLTFHITMKLKRNEESVFDVVTVLMRNSPIETLPNLEEIINNVLNSSSKNFDSPYTLSYLRVFQTFVICVSKWIKTVAKESPIIPKQGIELEQFIKYLEEVTKKPEVEEESEEEIPETTEYEDVPEEPEKPQLPRHLKLTLAVANHSLHYLPSKNKEIKIIVLEILNECVWALAESENDLLPLVHNIWSPLVTRFDSVSDPLVINRSFTLLCTLSSTSKDFIRKRTLKNVLPVLRSFLVKQSSLSKLKDSASGYFFTQNFKLQRELLGNLGQLTVNLGLFEKETDLVVECALPYLSSYQPQELQRQCQRLFQELMSYDPHLVWYKTHKLLNDPECSQNVQLVLGIKNCKETRN